MSDSGSKLLAVIGTAAGLAFSIAKMFINNFAKKVKKNEIVTSRILMIGILVCAGLLSLGDSATFILNWSFMSMGLGIAAAIILLLTTNAVAIPKNNESIVEGNTTFPIKVKTGPTIIAIIAYFLFIFPLI